MAAELMGLLDKIGTVEEGKLADIVVVSGNPLEDVRVLQPLENVKLVMKDGGVFCNRGVPLVMGS
jgi:imidazolonepropionase-like amidohydrolase